MEILIFHSFNPTAFNLVSISVLYMVIVKVPIILSQLNQEPYFILSHLCALNFYILVLTIILNKNYESFLFIFPYVAGTPEDKMRLFLIYYISAQQAPSEVCPLCSVIG